VQLVVGGDDLDAQPVIDRFLVMGHNLILSYSLLAELAPPHRG
jgi:hypothetical protein